MTSSMGGGFLRDDDTGALIVQGLDGVVQLQREAAAPTGALSETMPRQQVSSASQAFAASGRLQLIGVVMLKAGVPVTNLSWMTGSTLMVTPVNQWQALIRVSDKATLGKTTDDTTNVQAINSVKTQPLSAVYTPDEDELAYLGVLVKASTMPTMSGQAGVSGPLALAPPLNGLGPASLTDPASFTVVTTITGSAVQGYGYVS